MLQEESLNFEQDSLIINVEKLIGSSNLNDEVTELSILEKNKHKFLNLNPVNTNIISGKLQYDSHR